MKPVEKGILGIKLGMTQVYVDSELVPVTVIKAGPCRVLRVKTKETDGYSAIQLGFIEEPLDKFNKPMKGFFQKLGLSEGYKIIREIRLKDDLVSNYKPGDYIKVDIFQPGEKVKVTGTSKGHGFSGAIKRWGMSRGPMSHGSRHHRRPGSNAVARIGPTKKGKRRPGHYGVDTITIRNLTVIDVIPEDDLILIKGGVPGWRNGLVIITKPIIIPKKVRLLPG